MSRIPDSLVSCVVVVISISTLQSLAGTSSYDAFSFFPSQQMSAVWSIRFSPGGLPINCSRLFQRLCQSAPLRRPSGFSRVACYIYIHLCQPMAMCNYNLGRPGGNRTPNLRFWRPPLCQLSYWPSSSMCQSVCHSRLKPLLQYLWGQSRALTPVR